MTAHALRTIRPHRTRYRRRLEALRASQQLDPMQSSDERQFWSHPAPERREYDVRYARIDYPLLNPARGMFYSLLGGFVLWGLIGLVLWAVLMTRSQTLRFASEDEMLREVHAGRERVEREAVA